MNAKLFFFGFARTIGVFALFRRLSGRKLRILCYHGGCVGDEDRFNPKLFASASLIERRLEWLVSRGFTPVSLDHAVQGLQAGRPLPRLPVVVTLDDGWYSSARDLLPALARHRFPAALYLATREFQSGLPIADVTIAYVLWKAGPRRVRVAGLDPSLDGEYDLASRSVREALAHTARPWVDAGPGGLGGRVDRLEQFACALGVAREALDLGSRRFSYMNAEEVRLARENGCQIELHGHQHWFPVNAPDLLRQDVQTCRDVIMGLGLPRPNHYCYPSGEFDQVAPAALSAMGVQSATTCLPGLVDTGSRVEAYFLPRLLDGNSVSQVEFEAEMSGFTDVLRRMLGRAGGAPALAGRQNG